MSIGIPAWAVPAIITPPVSISICSGLSSSLSVTATGALSYQWQRSWLGLQDDFDLEEQRSAKENELNNIKHYAAKAA